MMLLLLPAVHADVFQIGRDAARTGVAADPGPKLDEVAWTIQLPGSVSRNPPLIIGDNAYIVTSDLRHRTHLDQNAIWQVSLADGSAAPIIELDDVRVARLGSDEEVEGHPAGIGRIYFPHAAVTDGDRFYVAGPERVVAYDGVSGAELWEWAHPVLTVEQQLVYCAPPALTERLLVLGCTTIGEPPGEGADQEGQFVQSAIFMVALDLDTGQQAWMWVRDPAMDALHENTPAPNPACTPLTRGGPCGLIYRGAPLIVGVSTFGSVVVASVVAVLEPPTGTEYKAVIALDMEGGGLEWIKQTTKDAELDPDGFIQISMMATGDDSEGYVAFRDLLRINPATGNVLEAFDLTARDELSDEIATSFALTDDRLFLTTARRIIAMDRHDFVAPIWDKALPLRSNGSWGYEPLTYADGVVYGRVTDGFQDLGPTDPLAAVAPENTSHFQAYDAVNGDLLWSHTISAGFAPRALPLHSYTKAAGLLLVAGQEGRVEAIGRTDASLTPTVRASDLYPAMGATVTLDATMTAASSWSRANASTDPSAFRVDWGDGTATDWQNVSTFSHAYDQAGDRHAILYVRNDAGQQSAETMTFHVGQTAPVPPNWIETAFARENQDLTFGILGVILALGGGAIALASRRRRHGRLHREIAAIDAAAQSAVGNPTRLGAAMEDRRARCHGLMLDGLIDESQHGVLERHIQAVTREQRVDQMRELFDFLPTALTRTLEAMLADGQITAVERRGIKAMIDENEVLTQAQKRKITALVNEWFEQDEKPAS